MANPKGGAGVLIAIAVVLALVAVVAGFWFMAPVVLAVAAVVAITQRNRVAP
jgi:hypothetical protein